MCYHPHPPSRRYNISQVCLLLLLLLLVSHSAAVPLSVRDKSWRCGSFKVITFSSKSKVYPKFSYFVYIPRNNVKNKYKGIGLLSVLSTIVLHGMGFTNWQNTLTPIFLNDVKLLWHYGLSFMMRFFIDSFRVKFIFVNLYWFFLSKMLLCLTHLVKLKNTSPRWTFTAR